MRCLNISNAAIKRFKFLRGLLVNPFEVNDIANAMIELFKNENTRLQLIQNGIQRKENFSWDKSANLLWDRSCITANNRRLALHRFN